MVIRIGITGGIGSGKSVVARLLALMGVPVYLSDVEARRLMHTDAGIRESLQRLVGSAVYRADGTLDRPLLAAYLFGSPEHVRQVNEIVHPCVKRDFRQWVSRHAQAPVVAIESAILIEAGFADEVDRIIMVYAPEALRIDRAARRDQASYRQIEQRIRAQMDDEDKRKSAHFTIMNDGETPLIPQLIRILSSLS